MAKATKLKARKFADLKRHNPGLDTGDLLNMAREQCDRDLIEHFVEIRTTENRRAAKRQELARLQEELAEIDQRLEGASCAPETIVESWFSDFEQIQMMVMAQEHFDSLKKAADKQFNVRQMRRAGLKKGEEPRHGVWTTEGVLTVLRGAKADGEGRVRFNDLKGPLVAQNIDILAKRIRAVTGDFLRYQKGMEPEPFEIGKDYTWPKDPKKRYSYYVMRDRVIERLRKSPWWREVVRTA